MRRSPEAPNGLVELMVAHLMEQAAGLGVRTVSLNFCMFRRVYADAERVGSGALTRFNYSVLGTLDRFWQLERLYVSNQKFEPEWFPRFFCLEDPVSLPQVALAAGMAEGFVPQPRLTHPTPRAPAHRGRARRGRRPGRQSPRCRGGRATTLGPDPPPAGAPGGPGACGPRGLPGRHSARPDHSVASLGADVWLRRTPVSVAGRVRSLRDHGGVVFATLTDAGSDVQLLLEDSRAGSGCRPRVHRPGRRR